MADELQDIRDRLTGSEHRGKSNTRRIEKLEEDRRALTEMSNNMAVMSEVQLQMSKKVDTLDQKVTATQNVPGSRWNKVIETLASGVVMAIVASGIALILK